MELSKRVTEIYDRLKKSKSQKAALEPQWKELDEFYRGDQYKNANIPPWVPKPVTNYIHLVVTTKRAALSSENPNATLRPLAPLDIEPMAQLQKIFEWAWKKAKARKTVRDAIETSKLLGTAIVQVYWDEMTGVLGGNGSEYEGEICMKEIDPMNFFIDPSAYRIEDAQWIHVTEKRPRKWVEKQFGRSLKDAVNDDDNYGENYEREYYQDKSGDKKTDMIDFHAHYEKTWNTEKVKEMRPVMDSVEMMDPMNPVEPQMEEVETDEEIGGWSYSVTYVAGGVELMHINRLEPNMYPFAILYDFKQRQDFWGKGTAGLILENQKLINKTESIIAMIGTMMQNPQKIISKRSGINPQAAMKYSMAPGHVWVTDDQVDRSVKWQELPQIPQALVNLAEMAKENIREITGLNEAYMGQSVGSLQTSGGVNSLIDRATMRDRDQMFDLEQFVEQLSRLLIAFAVTKYTEPRFIRFVEDKNKPEKSTTFMEFLGTDFADLDFDMEIDVSSKAPITQARREAELRELIQLQGQYNYNPRIVTPQEFVKGVNMVDADKIVERMNREEEQNKLDMLNQVAQMIFESVQGGVPMEEIMPMAQAHLQALESGEVPMDPNAAALGGGGIGSAANNIQAQQGAL